eukprot:180204-Alexandrium_andersonii.AAC.1
MRQWRHYTGPSRSPATCASRTTPSTWASSSVRWPATKAGMRPSSSSRHANSNGQAPGHLL